MTCGLRAAAATGATLLVARMEVVLLPLLLLFLALLVVLVIPVRFVVVLVLVLVELVVGFRSLLLPSQFSFLLFEAKNDCVVVERCAGLETMAVDTCPCPELDVATRG